MFGQSKDPSQSDSTDTPVTTDGQNMPTTSINPGGGFQMPAPSPAPAPPNNPDNYDLPKPSAPPIIDTNKTGYIMTDPKDTQVSNNSSQTLTKMTDPAMDDLIKIKQDALQQLSPLVDHLEQTPEEKFRTTMMMIQATDNQALISQAYNAAKDIKDDKARAQALLDIVNEINYFTQHHNS